MLHTKGELRSVRAPVFSPLAPEGSEDNPLGSYPCLSAREKSSPPLAPGGRRLIHGARGTAVIELTRVRDPVDFFNIDVFCLCVFV